MNKQTKQAKRELFVVTLTILGVYLTFKYLLPLVMPFLFAYLFARILLPVVRRLNKSLKFPYLVSTIVVVLLFFVIAAIVLYFASRFLFNQIADILQNIPIYQEAFTDILIEVCDACDHNFRLDHGSVYHLLEGNVNEVWAFVCGTIMPMMTEQTFNMFWGFIGAISIVFVFIVAVVCIILSYDELYDKYKKTNIYLLFHPVTSKLGNIGWAYVKTQSIILSINAVILVIGFLLLGYRYSIIIGVGIAIMDAFPVIGSGLFIVPMIVINLLCGQYTVALILLILYGLCELMHTILEPKLLGDRLGIKPIFSLLSMFIGLKLFGISGFILGPIGFVIIKIIVIETMQKYHNQEMEA